MKKDQSTKEKKGVENDLYSKRGVSSQKNEVHAAIKNLSKGLYPTAFCKILPDIAGDDNYCTISHADGAGTKSALAYAYWKETGDLSVWKGIAVDSLVMNLDDVLCIGATSEKMLYTLIIDRNKNLIPQEVLTALIEGTQEFIDELKTFGINIAFAGGETADVGDLVRTIVVDGVLTTRMARIAVITPNIQAGDLIVALASFGESYYEKDYNSGMGSNGLTSARHDLFDKATGQKYPDTLDPRTDQTVVYCGKHQLQTQILITETRQKISLGKFVLSPTRTYAPIFTEIREVLNKEDLHAIIHCSGGGQTKVMKFLSPKVRVIKNNMFPMPQLFNLIQKESGEPWKKMLQNFNCGHRMEVYCTKDAAQALMTVASIHGVKARIVGKVVPRAKKDPILTIVRGGREIHYE